MKTLIATTIIALASSVAVFVKIDVAFSIMRRDTFLRCYVPDSMRPTQRDPNSEPPILIPQRRALQQLPPCSPLRQMSIHELAEVLVVVAFEQVHQLVHHDVLQAFGWFLRQFQVDPDASAVGIAGAPSGCACA